METYLERKRKKTMGSDDIKKLSVGKGTTTTVIETVTQKPSASRERGDAAGAKGESHRADSEGGMARGVQDATLGGTTTDVAPPLSYKELERELREHQADTHPPVLKVIEGFHF